MNDGLNLHNEEVVVANYIDTWLFLRKCRPPRQLPTKSSGICAACGKPLTICFGWEVDCCIPERCPSSHCFHRKCLKRHIDKYTESRVLLTGKEKSEAKKPLFCPGCGKDAVVITEQDVMRVYGERKFRQKKLEKLKRLESEVEGELAGKQKKDQGSRCAVF